MSALSFSRIKGAPTGIANHLRSFFTPGAGHREFLWPISIDAVYYMDHFITAIDTTYWTATADSGTTAFAHQVGMRGRLFCTLDGGDEEAASLYGAKVSWYGDKNCGMLCIFKFDAITNLRFEVGLSTSPSDKTLPVVTDVDTPTVGNGGTDLAVVHMDTTQTLATMAFVTEGSTASMNPAKTNLGTLTPTADTYMGIKVWASGNAFSCEVFDASPTDGRYPVLASASHGDSVASQVEGGTAIAPWVFFQSTEAEAKTMTLDALGVWQDR